MPVIKEIGLGCTLEVGTSAGSTTFTAVAGLLSFSGPDGTADDIDTSNMDDANFKTFKRGQADAGECALTMTYGSTDASQKTLAGLWKSGKIVNWRVSYPTTATPKDTFDGYVKGMGRAIEKDAMITRNVSMKITGDPGMQAST